MAMIGSILTQAFPPSPQFTEKDIPSQAGKVFIVTGGNSGIGLEVVKILYSKGGTVYMAGRNAEKINTAIKALKSAHDPTANPGRIKSLILDLGDLSTIPACAADFLAQESRLDILFNNGGIAQVPAGSVSAQGHEAHVGTNCLGPFLLTQLLLPVLLRTAKSAPKAGVRVVWVSSGIIDIKAPVGGLILDELAPGHHSHDKAHNYSVSKAGDWLLASELDQRVRKHGIVSVALSPGQLKAPGFDRLPWYQRWLMKPLLHDPIMGAYTELWAALSLDVTCADGGRYALPWGRWHPSPRKDILESLRAKAEGGTGLAAEFWHWCEEQSKDYVGVGS
ncbi:putative oxidoreductase [Lachnellula occidentalis]|uniref:Putative oxidoreductase n=1 Tax=Lachnellula occidentalis TaxID=215460 RepID=A0A8H8RFG7_9HELO|nr:putative oxidoreductase [Lachnellula occidentalis]